MPDEYEAIEPGVVGRAEHGVRPVRELQRFRARGQVVACGSAPDRHGRKVHGDDVVAEGAEHRRPTPGAVATTVNENDR